MEILASVLVGLCLSLVAFFITAGMFLLARYS